MFDKRNVFDKLIGKRNSEAQFLDLPHTLQLEVLKWEKQNVHIALALMSEEGVNLLIQETTKDHWNKGGVFEALTRGKREEVVFLKLSVSQQLEALNWDMNKNMKILKNRKLISDELKSKHRR